MTVHITFDLLTVAREVPRDFKSQAENRQSFIRILMTEFDQKFRRVMTIGAPRSEPINDSSLAQKMRSFRTRSRPC